MQYVSEAWRDYQRRRFLRQDAERFRKPDPARYVSGSKQFYDVLYGRKYSPDQPRVPAGGVGGGQWTADGNGRSISSLPKIAFAGPAAAGARATVQLGLMLYTYMSAQNGPDTQAIVTFRARKFKTGKGELDFKTAQNLDRDEVGQVCPRLDEVQQRTDRAAAMVKAGGKQLSPQQYGTAVHLGLKDQIVGLNDPNFVAERSFLKSDQEAGYGAKGSIRVDVLEHVGNGTVCVYDIKTGESKLDGRRMGEIATNVYKNFPKTQQIIVSEIRPTR